MHVAYKRTFAAKLAESVRKRRVRGARMIRRLLGRPTSFYQCRYGGARFLVDLDDLVGYEIAIGRMEWRELALMTDACRRLSPDVFLDVGANIGLYSCVLGRNRLVPKILAFEPDRQNFARLMQNLALNDLSDTVEARELAVGARAGKALLAPAGNENRGLSKIASDGSGAYEVELVALDDIVPLQGRSIAIKIDVEDYEQEVLTGAERLFRENFGFAQIEARDDHLADAIERRMTGFGWRFVERYQIDLRFERP
jgi:FkbM family methyltransferase